ncbi:peptidoglycan DD-metalloendopeptidase family protein [Dyadobacter fanqingshengii]|uniref:M23 family metallopeptidase n=1 Tax=Dyadobacter fanqingshengii TaxID=2906443 RepID=A0A9X1P6R9_9BACT|nr:M23 family metallopeptidase [Dyadobacter fanqingshengii]MCF0039002.1 M23 family metallopeptidase [Dyadobacter fanqingshengii]USJ34176.1 M23 family metallopeptidase [Dyadobacter fanqingshengii]
MKYLIRLLIVALVIEFAVSCKPVPVSHWFPVTPLEHYEKELFKAKMEKTAAGQTWFRVSDAVLNDSIFSLAPYQERFFLGDSVPAQAIRLNIPEGRRLVIAPSREPEDTSSHFFMELYKIKHNGKPQRLDYISDKMQTLTYTNDDSDTLLLRLQTGLGEKIAVSLSLTTEPALGFPVSGHDMSSVISFWGADRDGGIRSHEGIDIRAKRGTPVVAAQNGFVTQTGTNNLGGKVVFLSSMNSPYSLYYAHLDSQLVSVGKRVVVGDTLGLVGNTGNAITTAPHLHFGIYARGSGAVNPLSFIDNRKEKIPGLPERSRWLGDTVRIRRKANLYISPQFEQSGKIASISANTLVRILGEMAKGFRVELENGTKGYIPSVPFEAYSKQISLNK